MYEHITYKFHVLANRETRLLNLKFGHTQTGSIDFVVGTYEHVFEFNADMCECVLFYFNTDMCEHVLFVFFGGCGPVRGPASPGKPPRLRRQGLSPSACAKIIIFNHFGF